MSVFTKIRRPCNRNLDFWLLVKVLGSNPRFRISLDGVCFLQTFRGDSESSSHLRGTVGPVRMSLKVSDQGGRKVRAIFQLGPSGHQDYWLRGKEIGA